MFARRAGWDLGPNELARRIEARRASGQPILDLTETNPTRCGLRAPGALLVSALGELARDPTVQRYEPDPRGHGPARAAVAALLAACAPTVEPEHVVLSAGTSEGYAHLFRLLADPGDAVLVPTPSYPLFDYLAELEGLTTRPYSLALDGKRWRIDFASLEAAAGPGARALVVVHPHNPTGALVDRAELAALNRICAEKGLALISDEVFADTAELDPDTPASLLEGAGTGALRFALSGVSKLLALPQLKLAWIVAGGPPHLRDEALSRLEVIADTFLSVSEPVQRLLPALLAGRETVRSELRERLTRNRATFHAALTAPHLALLPSRGGWSALLRVTRSGAGPPPEEDVLAATLLDQRGLLVHPGWFFDLAPEADGERAAHLVLSLLGDPEIFARGAQELAEALA